MGTLGKRLAALEAMAPGQAEDVRITNYAELRASLAAFRPWRPPPDTERVKGFAGVRHYREDIRELEELAKKVPPPDISERTNFERLRIELLPRGLPALRWYLRGAELDVLADAGYDPAQLAAWRAPHARYEVNPTGWIGEALPAGAVAAIEAALARENSGEFQE